jgi:DNA-binding PadR family transcriptional regulator
MTGVFSHGRLRLYLLKLLAEGAKHGYELIRLLEQRFLGLYAPSAGTIYPRLARLEAEGLVTHTAAGGRKTYEITEAGRAELAARDGELVALESDIRASVEDLTGLANEIQDRVRGSVRDLKRELRDAVRETSAGRSWSTSAGLNRPGTAARPGAPADAGAPGQSGRPWATTSTGTPGAELERRLLDFTAELRRLIRGVKVDDSAVSAIGQALDTAIAELRRILR